MQTGHCLANGHSCALVLAWKSSCRKRPQPASQACGLRRTRWPESAMHHARLAWIPTWESRPLVAATEANCWFPARRATLQRSRRSPICDATQRRLAPRDAGLHRYGSRPGVLPRLNCWKCIYRIEVARLPWTSTWSTEQARKRRKKHQRSAARCHTASVKLVAARKHSPPEKRPREENSQGVDEQLGTGAQAPGRAPWRIRHDAASGGRAAS